MSHNACLTPTQGHFLWLLASLSERHENGNETVSELVREKDSSVSHRQPLLKHKE